MDSNQGSLVQDGILHAVFQVLYEVSLDHVDQIARRSVSLEDVRDGVRFERRG